jgi:DNA-nicking Smr family endonuclease
LIKRITEKDKKDWEDFLSDKKSLFNKDKKNQETSIVKTRVADLHGYTLNDANKFVNRFIKESYKNKVKKLIIITGKGIHSDNEKDPYKSKDLSILKYSVPEHIKGDKSLMSIINNIENASIEDGGEGAFYIYLKKNNNIL